MRTLYRVALALLIVPALALADSTDVRSYVGAATSPKQINWEVPQNWSPVAAPTIQSVVSIAMAAPYVAVTSPIGIAREVNVLAGGKLALRAMDNLKTLGVLTDMTVEYGGAFVGVGGSGKGGPIVVIGGNIINHGTWDLSGIATGHPSVVLLSCKKQRISGSQQLVFENLFASHQFVVDGVDVYVVGKYTGPWPEEINDGHFIVGEHPLPITLAYFTANVEAGTHDVNLTWRTVSETNNYGFFVERRAATAESYDTVAFVPTQGNGIIAHDYSMNDASAAAGSWYYRLRQVDLDGTESTTDEVLVEISSTTAVNETAPVEFGLNQNYPNPFNPETVIRFSVGVTGSARLNVYDAVGREVATLFNGAAEAGQYYTVSFNGAGLSSGTYFYRLESGSKVEMKRMMLVK